MRLSLLFPAGLLLGAATSVLAYDPNMTVQVVDNMADTGAAEGLALLKNMAAEIDAQDKSLDGAANGGMRIECHYKGTDLGGACSTPFMKDTFWHAAESWCNQFHHMGYVIVPTGQFYPTKLADWNCGSNDKDNKGKKCDFVGQIRMDRDTDRGTAPQGWNYIDKGRCMEHIQAIWDTCGGYGGYINPSYGTVFMYCTETAGPMGEV